MNKNIKNGALLALAASAGLTSCSRYDEGGPSLRSAKSRLTGEWELQEVNGPDGDGFDEILDDVSYTFEFDKDGDVKVKVEGEITYTYYGYSYTYDFNYSEKGDWEFENGKKEIVIEFEGDEMEFDIIKLKNKELILEDEDGNEWEFEKKK